MLYRPFRRLGHEIRHTRIRGDDSVWILGLLPVALFITLLSVANSASAPAVKTPPLQAGQMDGGYVVCGPVCLPNTDLDGDYQ